MEGTASTLFYTVPNRGGYGITLSLPNIGKDLAECPCKEPHLHIFKAGYPAGIITVGGSWLFEPQKLSEVARLTIKKVVSDHEKEIRTAFGEEVEGTAEGTAEAESAK